MEEQASKRATCTSTTVVPPPSPVSTSCHGCAGIHPFPHDPRTRPGCSRYDAHVPSVGRHGDGHASLPTLAHARSLGRCADRQAKQRSIRDWDLRFCFQSLRAALICGLIKVTQRCDKPHSTVRAPWNADIGQRYRGTSAGPVVLVPGAFPVPCPSAPKALASPRMYLFFFFPAPLAL